MLERPFEIARNTHRLWDQRGGGPISASFIIASPEPTPTGTEEELSIFLDELLYGSGIIPYWLCDLG